jgi:hypothetical protein
MFADSSFASSWTSAAISGMVGYASCAGGNASAACPFYVGSLDLRLDESLVIDLDCNGLQQLHELSDLEIQLVQPAFGVDGRGTVAKALPPGGLVLAASGQVDEIPFSTRKPIEQAIYLDVSASSVQIDETSGLRLDFEVPCNGEMADVQVWWEMDSSGVQQAPPTVVIDMPSTVSCPENVDLKAIASDPDADLASVRWEVDGVLLHAPVDAIGVAQSHEVRAIARDARGATTTATHSIACAGS